MQLQRPRAAGSMATSGRHSDTYKFVLERLVRYLRPRDTFTSNTPILWLVGKHRQPWVNSQHFRIIYIGLQGHALLTINWPVVSRPGITAVCKNE